MSFVNRLFQRMTGNAFNRRARRRREFSPFGIVAAQVQVLENRRLLSALTVTTAADSGAGSLRAEIAAANNGDTINFASSLKGQTITLTSGALAINTGLTIQGPGAAQLTISGGNHSEVFQVGGTQPVVLAGLTITNGAAPVGSGGAVSNATGSTLTISGCTISNSRAALNGGGIFNAGTLTLSQCTISGNSAFTGGGIDNSGTLTATGCTISGDVAGGNIGGGGIYNSGTLTATGCTLSGDSATSGLGGGIDAPYGRTTLTNCTLAGDFARGNANSLLGGGGGLYVGRGVTWVTNCTVSLNRAGLAGGGIGLAQNVELVLRNTIVAGNTAGIGPDVYGSAISDHDLIGNGSGCNIVNGMNGNIVGSPSHIINALLGPLQNNGGPTMTMALLAGSPAIGHADNATAPATDQRGVTRRDLPGEFTDMGAFEL